MAALGSSLPTSILADKLTGKPAGSVQGDYLLGCIVPPLKRAISFPVDSLLSTGSDSQSPAHPVNYLSCWWLFRTDDSASFLGRPVLAGLSLDARASLARLQHEEAPHGTAIATWSALAPCRSSLALYKHP
ncbi:hypothetical protein N7510_001349 [Penicillium lagena]|uniref:uncharacterized protein n=1 Tax=Penicillium lagena TaxID=94218 RepID=UPI002541A3C5|nr:uncharacterized protein N7510_001349 [Penicillium lagena]KAJ5625040.1 hypothetical protein N7510_001349 [Penicillium lagena]